MLWAQILAVAVTPVVLSMIFQHPPAETSSVWDRQPSPHKLPMGWYGCWLAWKCPESLRILGWASSERLNWLLSTSRDTL